MTTSYDILSPHLNASVVTALLFINASLLSVAFLLGLSVFFRIKVRRWEFEAAQNLLSPLFVLSSVVACFAALEDQNSVLWFFFAWAFPALEIFRYFLGTEPQRRKSAEEIGPIVTVYNVNGGGKGQNRLIEWVNSLPSDFVILLECGSSLKSRLQSTNTKFAYLHGDLNSAGLSTLVFSDLPVQITSFASTPAGQIDKEILIGEFRFLGQNIRLVAAHLFPPKFQYRYVKQLSSSEQLIRFIKSSNKHTILAGDLNMTIWSSIFRKFVLAGLKTCFWTAAFRGSWPNLPVFPKIMIDHVFVSAGLNLKYVSTKDPNISDHKPITAVIAFD